MKDYLWKLVVYTLCYYRGTTSSTGTWLWQSPATQLHNCNHPRIYHPTRTKHTISIIGGWRARRTWFLYRNPTGWREGWLAPQCATVVVPVIVLLFAPRVISHFFAPRVMFLIHQVEAPHFAICISHVL
jgi:hypothetical protein